MKKGFVYALSGFLVVSGMLLVLNSFSGITGYSVFGDVNRTAGSIIGIVFVIGGIALFTHERMEDSSRPDYEYRRLAGDLLSDYKKNPTRTEAIVTASSINKIGEVKGLDVDYSGDSGKIYTSKGIVPMSFADKDEGRNLFVSLARVTLQNDPKNINNISGLKNLQETIKEFEQVGRKKLKKTKRA